MSTVNEQAGLACGVAASMLGLSPLATQVMRLGLMLLKWSMRATSGRSLKVSIRSGSCTISVSRHRRSTSSPRRPRQRSLPLTVAPGSGYTATTSAEIVQLPTAASSSLALPDNASLPSRGRGIEP